MKRNDGHIRTLRSFEHLQRGDAECTEMRDAVGGRDAKERGNMKAREVVYG